MASQPNPAENPVAGTDPFADGAQDAHIADIFGFDPVDAAEPGNDDEPTQDASGLVPGDPDPSPAEASPAADAGSSVGAGEGEGGALEGAPPEPTAPVVPDENKLKLTSLEQQVADLTAQLAAKETAAPKPEETPAAAAEAPKPISIKLPDPLRDAITSGDDDQMLGALDNIVSGLATQIQQVAHLCLTEIAAVRSLVDGGGASPSGATKPGAASTPSAGGDPALSVEAAREAMRTDYFSKFPAHKGPEFQPILAAVAQEMASSLPGHPWNEDYINAMGARVADRAKALAKAMNPSGVGGTPASPLPAGTRSARPAAGEQDISDEIMDTLGDWGS